MIRVHAFVVVLLMELAAIGLALAAVFFMKNRKNRFLYRKALSDCLDAKASSPGRGPTEQAASEAQKHPEKKSDTKAADYARALQEKEHLAAKVKELEAKLLADKNILENLEKKHAALENEYSILYDRHVTGKGKDISS